MESIRAGRGRGRGRRALHGDVLGPGARFDVACRDDIARRSATIRTRGRAAARVTRLGPLRDVVARRLLTLRPSPLNIARALPVLAIINDRRIARRGASGTGPGVVASVSVLGTPNLGMTGVVTLGSGLLGARLRVTRFASIAVPSVGRSADGHQGQSKCAGDGDGTDSVVCNVPVHVSLLVTCACGRFVDDGAGQRARRQVVDGAKALAPGAAQHFALPRRSAFDDASWR